MTDWTSLIGLTKWVLVTLAFWTAWSVRHVFIAAWRLQAFLKDYERDKMEADRDVILLKQRMDKAGTLTSDLATEVQGLPERLRREFRDEYITRREVELIRTESQIDRNRLHADVGELWAAMNTQRRPS